MDKVSENLAPFSNGKDGVWYWERSSDPFHPDAFKGVDLKDKTLVLAGANGISSGTRAKGWMGIDYAENAVCFVPDGTDTANMEYLYRMGPCGHMCAYPEPDHPETKRRLEIHAATIARKAGK